MFSRSLHLLFVALLVVTVSLPVLAQAKKAPESPKAQPTAAGLVEWEMMSPEGEEFTVQMPKGASAETTKFPYHKMELNTRFYLSSITGGSVLAIASFSGIKLNPAAYSDFERFNSYIDAFKDFFPPKVRPGTLMKLSPIGNKPLHGNTGRQFKVTLGDLSGVMQAYITRRRFYAIVSLNTKKDDALDEKFISSFVLPEKVDKPAATVTAEASPNTPADPNAQQQSGINGGRKELSTTDDGSTPVTTVAEDNTEAGTANVPAGGANQNSNQQGQQSQKKGPISGGMLNGKAIYLPSPEVPSGEATGVVIVQVIVDEQGGVTEARAVAGPPALHAAAVNAARLARFNPTFMMGEAVRVSGTLSYNFVRSN